MKRLVLFLVAWWLADPCFAQQKPDLPSKDLRIPATDEGLPGTGPIRRYDWFQSLWVKRRTEWAARTQMDQQAVVFLGDSITQGWNNDLGGSFPGVKVANRGISGDTTRGMLIRLREDVLSLNPKAVVILMGTNDLEEEADSESIANNAKLLLAELKQHNPNMPIVMCQVFPSSATKKRPADKIRKVNELYAAAVKGDRQVILVDTWTLFANPQGDANAAEFPDLLHPNAAGYAKWASALRPILATLGFLQAETDTFTLEPGFESLFNGRDLTGWGYRRTSEEDLRTIERLRAKNADNAPAWPVVTEPVNFPGQTSTPDGRYVAMNGRLVVTTPPEGRKIQQLWTTREFPGDFTLKLEFRASPNADSGVFIRLPQLQCRDYLLAGPYKNLKQYKPQDWNELTITVKGNVAHCTCNGEVLEAELKLPPTGPIGLEGDRGQMEYRRIRIRTGDNMLQPTNRLATWRLELTEQGKGSMEVQDEAIVFRTTETDGTNWHVQAYQIGLALKEKAEYVVRFKMKSPNSSSVLLLGIINQADWHEIGLHEEILPGPQFADYEFTFTATNVVPNNNRIGFILGTDKGTVFVSDMTLREKPPRP